MGLGLAAQFVSRKTTCAPVVSYPRESKCEPGRRKPKSVWRIGGTRTLSPNMKTLRPENNPINPWVSEKSLEPLINMPIPLLADVLFKGINSIPYAVPILTTIPWLIALVLLKLYFGGASNTSERLMHSKVIMITGGTSGIGAAVTESLATRGAQIILLTHHPPSDPFLVEYIDDLRVKTKNELVYAEQVDLSSLQSIRLFATKWVDNSPPRRLDMVILCADTLTPRFGIIAKTQDQVESNWGINYLANFHLLSILSPALRAQPPDRDVRIIFGTCSSYLGGDLKPFKYPKAPLRKGKEYGTSKLASMVFAVAFQKHLEAYKRPDKQPNNARVLIVDPGYTRTPGMRRWLSMGSLSGLAIYLCMWPLWWLVLKSPLQGAQGFLRAVMEAEFGRGGSGEAGSARFIKECKEMPNFLRGDEVRDEGVAKELWGLSEKQIEALEKEGAVLRSIAKKLEKESANGKEKLAEKIDGAKGKGNAESKGTESQGKKASGLRRSRKVG